MWQSARNTSANISEVAVVQKGKRTTKVSFQETKMAETVGREKEPAISDRQKRVRFEDKPRGMKKTPVVNPPSKKPVASHEKPCGNVSMEVPLKGKHTLPEKDAVTNQDSKDNGKLRSRQQSGNPTKGVKRKFTGIASTMETIPKQQPKKAKINSGMYTLLSTNCIVLRGHLRPSRIRGIHALLSLNCSGFIDHQRCCTLSRPLHLHCT